MSSNHGGGRQDIDIPHDFLCPIGQIVMADPVTTVDGHTYERDNIEQWLLVQGKNVSPVTNLKLASKTLTPVLVVRSQIRAFIEKNPELVDMDAVYLPKAAILKFHASIQQGGTKREFEEMVKSDFRVLLRKHPDSSMTGLQAVCEHGTYDMLNHAMTVLESRGRLALLDEQKVHPPHWFPKLLIRELPLAVQARDQRKIDWIRRLGVHKGTVDAILLDAARLGDLDCVRALLSVGANVNCVGNEGMTPLIKACCKGFEDVSRELLIVAGANANACDANGWSALHWAVDINNRALVEMLIRSGADLSVRDRSECTPMMLASRHSCLQDFITALLYRMVSEAQQRLVKLERVVQEMQAKMAMNELQQPEQTHKKRK